MALPVSGACVQVAFPAALSGRLARHQRLQAATAGRRSLIVVGCLGPDSSHNRRSAKGRLPLSGGDVVLALNQAAGIVPSGYVTQPNVVRQGAEQRNPFSN